MFFNPLRKGVILPAPACRGSEAPRRPIAYQRVFMARSRRTPAMLVGRCSSELSGHQLQGSRKSHRYRPKRPVPACRGSVVEGSAAPRTLLGNVFRQSEAQSRDLRFLPPPSIDRSVSNRRKKFRELLRRCHLVEHFPAAVNLLSAKRSSPSSLLIRSSTTGIVACTVGTSSVIPSDIRPA